MYAVIETGGKQYRVELGNEIAIDRLDAAPGDSVEIDRVLLVADGDDAQIGRPVVDGALVSASVVRQVRGDKIVVFKYRPKARHRAKQGHRQELTVIRIADISFDGRSAAKEAAAEAKELEKERRVAADEAARQAAADRQLAARLASETEASAAEAESKAGKGSRAVKAKATDSAKAKATDGAKAKATDGAKAKATAPAKAKATESAKAAAGKKSAPAKAAGAKSETPAKAKRTQTKKDE